MVTDPNAVITSGSPIASLNPGESAQVTAEHEITAADVNASVFINTATVDGDSAAGDPGKPHARRVRRTRGEAAGLVPGLLLSRTPPERGRGVRR